ncbi:hypothetical protein FY034_11305 [Trichlorobacter lovleyi]|nr:hypothetical protein FY034_11305 [Trichlorobacter lovleyi]
MVDQSRQKWGLSPFPIPIHKSHLVKTVISRLAQNILTQSLMDWLLLWSSLLMYWMKKTIEPSSLSLLELLLLKYASTINRKLDRVKASDSIKNNIIVTAILYYPAYNLDGINARVSRLPRPVFFIVSPLLLFKAYRPPDTVLRCYFIG